MSGPFGSSQWMYASGDFQIANSLRFNDDNAATFSFTPSTNGTSTDVFTVSFWCKRGKLGESQYLFDIAETTIAFNANDFLIGNLRGTESGNYFWNTNNAFRDTNAWLHIVAAYDSTQGTDTNRFKLYINGELQVAADFSSISYMPQNREMKNTTTHYIGYEGSGYAFDGHLAEYYMIDGQQLTAASFGEIDDTYGHWKPIEYDGTYGTNGFYLNFKGGGIIAANGGTITTDGDYKVHSFTSNGTFTPTSVSGDGFVEYLVIAGGGSGGGAPSRYGSGGGAGGYRTGMLAVTAQDYSITVGAGGVVSSDVADKGDDSVFSTITSTGGGRGTTTANNTNDYTSDVNGGSGGGAGTYGQGSAGTGISGQGNNGGAGSSNAATGGGGGAGGVGGTAEAAGSEIGGLGGAGLASTITGSSVTRAGGGGGGAWGGTNHAGSAGGSGGGGRGNGNGNAGTDGTANTGSGGGGGGYGHNGGDGGSGIVIIRYKFQ